MQARDRRITRLLFTGEVSGPCPDYFVEVTAQQSDVAIVSFEIHIEDRAENWDTSDERIQQHVA
ncbi:hypothetical protein X731_24510 [Mesorhizobium sp. L2C054A000]|nr:hypothetical protein X731_24510 [Mesorhizobium sp. L2C054A000]